MAHESLSTEDKRTILNGHFPVQTTTHAVDYIHDVSAKSFNEGDSVIETSSGRMYIKAKGELVLVSEPTPETGVPQSSNPLKGKGKSYGKHVENGWGQYVKPVSDWNDPINDWADPFNP